jgi:tyrosine-protein phosphatase YwqE
MFSLFNSGYYLKEVMPNNYLDIHNHILPGIDDGSKTIEETSLLIDQMQLLNIAAAVATPHTFNGVWNNTSHTIKAAFERATATQSNSSFLRGFASEYMLDKTLVERAKNEPLLSIYDSFILVEIPFLNYPLDLYELFFGLKEKGYKIILAHPERYLYFHFNINKYKQLKEFGIFFQLNLLSLAGYYGKEVQKIAQKLLDNDWYDFSGTDIHNLKHVQFFAQKKLRYSNKQKLIELLQKNWVFNE